MNKGYPAAISAYLIWGISPLYWHVLVSVPVLEILGLRIMWAVPFMLAVLFMRRNFTSLAVVVKNPWRYKVYFLTPFLLATNWVIWIWSVNNGHVVDASLGYFINPLINVVMGLLLLQERLRRVQWISLFLALTGVLYLAVSYGQFPWIALTLAGTFALYGYIRKTASLGAINGLAVEIAVLLLPSIILLFILGQGHPLVFLDLDIGMHIWLSLAGLVTVLPLTVFAYGARHIPYSTLGFIQYIAPTGQFLIGIYIFNEVFSPDKFIGFCFIWLALIVYSFENLIFQRKMAKRSVLQTG